MVVDEKDLFLEEGHEDHGVDFPLHPEPADAVADGLETHFVLSVHLIGSPEAWSAFAHTLIEFGNPVNG